MKHNRPKSSSTAALVRWLPRSLMGRHLLLSVVLVLAAQAITLLLLRELVVRPRVAQMADGLAQHLVALHRSLAVLDPQARARFVQAFNQRQSESTVRRETDATSRPIRMLALEGFVARELLQRLKVHAPLQGVVQVSADAGSERNGAGADLRVVLVIDGQAHALRFAGLLPVREPTGALLLSVLASTLLAAVGAWALQRRLNQPLAEVARVARQVSRGQVASPLREDGPQEIAAVGSAINQMVNSLAHAERERALLLAGISHDLRTPLTKLRLGLEMVEPVMDAALARSMNRSIEESDRLLGQFLDYARAGENEAPLQASLNELAQAMAQVQADHGRDLQLSLGDVPEVTVYPQALQRALENLLENAWRYGAPPVTLRTGEDARWVWIEVSDQGPGVPEAALAQLSQPFVRGEGAQEQAPGAGLGLAIADRVARAHGGWLALTSGPASGFAARLVISRNGRKASEKPDFRPL